MDTLYYYLDNAGGFFPAGLLALSICIGGGSGVHLGPPPAATVPSRRSGVVWSGPLHKVFSL